MSSTSDSAEQLSRATCLSDKTNTSARLQLHSVLRQLEHRWPHLGTTIVLLARGVRRECSKPKLAGSDCNTSTTSGSTLRQRSPRSYRNSALGQRRVPVRLTWSSLQQAYRIYSTIQAWVGIQTEQLLVFTAEVDCSSIYASRVWMAVSGSWFREYKGGAHTASAA